MSATVAGVLAMLSEGERETIIESLACRALDRQADHYGDGGADNAADLFTAITGEAPTDAHIADG